MYNFPDLTPLLYLAIVGFGAIVLAALGAVGFAVWFVMNHVQII